MPVRKGFMTVGQEGVHLMTFRSRDGRGVELRVAEIEGQRRPTSVELAIPVVAAFETDLLGNRIGPVPSSSAKLSFDLQPWRVRSFEIR